MGRRLFVLAMACAFAACTTVEDRVTAHERQLRSLASTAAVISDAWLNGRVSDSFAATALSQALVLVERERATLGTDVDVLRDETGGRVSQDAEQLARQLASMIGDVHRGNDTDIRRRMAALPRTPAVPR